MIFVDTRSPKPLYEQIKESVRTQVLCGVLRVDEKLPSVRELAAETAINPNTIQKAYRDLEAEGLIYTAPGRGCFVAEQSDTQRNKRRAEVLGRVRPLVQELLALGMAEEEIFTWVKGGMQNDN